MENFERFYPPKPSLTKPERKGHIAVTFFSIVLFALTFSFIINDYLLILFLVTVLLIHELGHFLVMKFFGYKELKMFFIPFLGAMVQGGKEKYSQLESALMVMAGPLPGIIAGFFLLNYGIGTEISWAIQLGLFFMIINVVNLFPVDPLDGGQLLRLILFGSQDLIQLVFSFISSLFVIGLGLYLNSWILIGFGFFMGLRVKSSYKNYRIRKELREGGVVYESSYDKLSDKSFSMIKDVIISYNPILTKIQQETETDKFNQIVANQVDGVLQVPTKKDLTFSYKLIMTIIWLGAFYLCLYTALTIDINMLKNAF